MRSSQCKYQARQLVESLRYISLSLQMIQGDIPVLAESICLANKSKVNLEEFQNDLFIEVQKARKAIAKSLVTIDDLKGGEA